MPRVGVAVTAAFGATAAVAVAVALLVGCGPEATGPSAATAAVSASPTTPAGKGSIDVHSLPPRGSLSSDGAAVAKVGRLRWEYPGAGSTATVSSPPPTLRRVLFVGGVPGGVAAYVVGPAGAQLLGAWFAGPTVESLSMISVVEVRDRTTPVALLSRRSGLLLVLAAPGDTAALSLQPNLDRMGNPKRTYRELPMRDGIAAATVPVKTGDAASLRIVRGSTVAFRGAVPASGELFDAQLEPTAAIRFARTTSEGSSALALPVADQIGRDIAGRLGLSLKQLDLTVLWTGNLRTVAGGTASVVAARLTLPSGGNVLAVQATATPTGADTGTSTLCAQTTSAAKPAARLVLAVRCHLGASATAPLLVVIAPASAVRAVVQDASGAVLSRLTLDRGVGSVSGAAAAAVQVRAASTGADIDPVAVLGPPVLDIGDAGPTRFT